MNAEFLTNPTTWTVLVLVIVAAVFAYLWWRARTTGATADPLAMLAQANVIARDIVAAAEQLYRSGKLPRESRYDWAANELKRVAPGLAQEQVIAAVEAGVYWLKQAGSQAGVTLPAAPGLPQPPTAPMPTVTFTPARQKTAT